MLTHQIAVNAYLVVEGKFLLLRRTNPPLLWGPPGGRLDRNEDPIIGLKREVYEETRLEIEIVQPVTTWFGEFNSKQLLSIDYLSYAQNLLVHLSEEHSQFSWCSIKELYEKRSVFFIHKSGFQFADFLKAWMVFLSLNGKFQQLEEISSKFRKYLPNQIQYPPAQKL